MLQPSPSRDRELGRDRARIASRHWGAVAVATAVLSFALALGVAGEPGGGSARELAGRILLVAGLVLLWAAGLRSLAMWFRAVRVSDARPTGIRRAHAARVALLYCTADDFDGAALSRSSRQTVPADIVLLDDSTRAEVKADIDDFAARVGARVIRRSTRTGFKAGNINHAMEVLADGYEFVVVLDSDSVLSHDFVERALAVCAGDPGIGIVQSRVEAAPGGTRFTEVMAGLLGTHLQLTQAARTRIGFGHLLGRGALIRTACFTAAGGVPELVMEDVAFTVAARRAGYRVAYLPSVVTVEEYPVDYAAFRVQYRKMVEGSVELLLRGGVWGRRSRLAWWERLDLVWELINAPLASFAGAAVAGAGVVLATDGAPLALPVWAVVVTSLTVAAPLLPQTLRVLGADGILPAARFLATGSLLYGSTMVLAVGAAARVLLGRAAVFRVTPKAASPRRAGWMRGFAPEAVVAAFASLIALRLTGTLLPVLPLLLPAVAAYALALWGGRDARARGAVGRDVQRASA